MDSKPVSQTVPTLNSQYNSLCNKNISIEQRNMGNTASINIGNVDIGTSSSGLISPAPEIGKGSIVDLKV